MAFVLIQSGVVVQKQPYSEPGFTEAPDDVVCGQIWSDGVFSNPPPPPPTSYIISKTTPWRRMTQAEAATMDAAMAETEAQVRNIYNSAQYLSTSDELWGALRDLIASSLGSSPTPPLDYTRADQLLAPET